MVFEGLEGDSLDGPIRANRIESANFRTKNAPKFSPKFPREARDLISKIRSCTVRSDLKNKAFSAAFCLFLRSDLTVQDRILEIRSLASLGFEPLFCGSEKNPRKIPPKFPTKFSKFPCEKSQKKN